MTAYKALKRSPTKNVKIGAVTASRRGDISTYISCINAPQPVDVLFEREGICRHIKAL